MARFFDNPGCGPPCYILLLLPPRWAAASRLLPAPTGELSVELEYKKLEYKVLESKEQELDRGGWAGRAWSG